MEIAARPVCGRFSQRFSWGFSSRRGVLQLSNMEIAAQRRMGCVRQVQFEVQLEVDVAEFGRFSLRSEVYVIGVLGCVRQVQLVSGFSQRYGVLQLSMSSCFCMCVLIRSYIQRPLTTICVLILLYMFPHTTMYICADQEGDGGEGAEEDKDGARCPEGLQQG